MKTDRVKRTLQVAALLLAVVFLAGAILLATLNSVSGKPVQKTFHAYRTDRMAYLGAGGFASSRYASAPQTGDYLRDIGAEGYHRWPANKFPLRVYIDNGSGVPGYRSNFAGMVAESFNEWSRTSGGAVSWRQVSDPRQADVVSLWTADATARGGAVEAGNTVTLTKVDPRTGNGVIQAAKITILTQLNGRAFSDTDMKKTALHEVGHSLGLEGHSRTQSDIMYAAVNPAQVPYLKQRDANTLALLYGNNANDSRYIAAAPSGLQGLAGIGNNYYGGGSGLVGGSRLGNLGSGLGNALSALGGGSNNYGYSQPYGASFGRTGKQALRDIAWAIGREIVRSKLGI